MTAPKNNRNAAKPKKDKAEEKIQIRVKAADLRRWDKAAKAAGLTRSAWLTAIANREAK